VITANRNLENIITIRLRKIKVDLAASG